jgi:hypothetical protein
MQPIESISGHSFTIESAVQYIHYSVAERSIPASERYKPSRCGVIVGLLDMNEEVELIIQFGDQVRQFTLSEVRAKLEIVDD